MAQLILPKELTKHRAAIAQATTKPIHGLPQKQQYDDTEPIWMSNMVKPYFPNQIETLGRNKGAYLMFFKETQEVSDDTLGKSPQILEQEFAAKGLTGWTLEEALLHQRQYTEQHVREVNPHPETLHYAYLLNSRVLHSGSARMLVVDWDSADCQMNVYSYFMADEDAGAGGRPSAIFELGA